MKTYDALHTQPAGQPAADFHTFRFDRITKKRAAKIQEVTNNAVNGEVVVNGVKYPLGRVIDTLDEIFNDELEHAGWKYNFKKDIWEYEGTPQQ